MGIGPKRKQQDEEINAEGIYYGVNFGKFKEGRTTHRKRYWKLEGVTASQTVGSISNLILKGMSDDPKRIQNRYISR